MSTRKRGAPEDDEGRAVRPKMEPEVMIEGGPVNPGAPSKQMTDEEIAHWNAMFYELMVSFGLR